MFKWLKKLWKDESKVPPNEDQVLIRNLLSYTVTTMSDWTGELITHSGQGLINDQKDYYITNIGGGKSNMGAYYAEVIQFQLDNGINMFIDGYWNCKVIYKGDAVCREIIHPLDREIYYTINKKIESIKEKIVSDHNINIAKKKTAMMNHIIQEINSP